MRKLCGNGCCVGGRDDKVRVVCIFATLVARGDEMKVRGANEESSRAHAEPCTTPALIVAVGEVAP